MELNHWLSIRSLRHNALSHQAIWKIYSSNSVRIKIPGWWQPPWSKYGFTHGFKPWTFEGLPRSSRPCTKGWIPKYTAERGIKFMIFECHLQRPATCFLKFFGTSMFMGSLRGVSSRAHDFITIYLWVTRW